MSDTLLLLTIPPWISSYTFEEKVSTAIEKYFGLTGCTFEKKMQIACSPEEYGLFVTAMVDILPEDNRTWLLDVTWAQKSKQAGAPKSVPHASRFVAPMDLCETALIKMLIPQSFLPVSISGDFSGHPAATLVQETIMDVLSRQSPDFDMIYIEWGRDIEIEITKDEHLRMVGILYPVLKQYGRDLSWLTDPGEEL